MGFGNRSTGRDRGIREQGRGPMCIGRSWWGPIYTGRALEVHTHGGLRLYVLQRSG